MPGPNSGVVRVDASAAPELADGLALIQREHPGRFADDATTTLRLAPGRDEGFAISADGVISYARPSDAFRGLGVAMGGLLTDGAVPAREEASPFTDRSVMLDVSRNSVLRPATVSSLFARMALMGINGVWLYMEDTYEVPEEPMFGYFRGRYTADELRQIDDAGHALGIEVIPCIQTLGHLKEILQWPAYIELQDADGVLLADEPETYALLRRMITAATAPFRSNRVHLGMDEAHGIGTGAYARKHGYRRAFDILNEHLEKVLGICRELDLKPMIWSDMYFRLGSPINGYYDRDSVIPPEIAAGIPADVQLVYWDYYHGEQDFYEEWIDRHRALGKEPVFSGGTWTWNRFWTQLPKSIAYTQLAMNAARNRGLKEVSVTLWGDDGAECDVYSALPGLQAFADNAYEGNSDNARLAENFRGSCGGTLADWIAAAEIDIVPGADRPELPPANPGKWLLWHDPILGYLDVDIAAETADHYRGLGSRLSAAARQPGDERLAFPAAVAAAVALKVELHTSLKARYRAADTAGVRDILDRLLPDLETAVRFLWATHRRMWLGNSKPFGWDVIERRYGGLLARLDGLSAILADWLADPSRPIDELDLPVEHVYPGNALARVIGHRQAASPSVIA
jgi:hypothetical protein